MTLYASTFPDALINALSVIILYYNAQIMEIFCLKISRKLLRCFVHVLLVFVFWVKAKTRKKNMMNFGLWLFILSSKD